MARNTSILLSDYYLNFIDSKVTSGQYASASEMVREGLRLLENEDLKLQKLRDALRMGEESGIVHDFDPEEHLRKLNGGIK